MLAHRLGFHRFKSVAKRMLERINIDTAQAFLQLGTLSRTEQDGMAAWVSGNLTGAIVAFAGANLSVPKRWLLPNGFDERPGVRWGLEDLALALRLVMDGHLLAVAELAGALHLSHYRGAAWKEQQRQNVMCLEFLPPSVSEVLLSYLEGAQPLTKLELQLKPHFEAARRRMRLAA